MCEFVNLLSKTKDHPHLNGVAKLLVQLRCHVDLHDADFVAQSEAQDAWIGLQSGAKVEVL